MNLEKQNVPEFSAEVHHKLSNAVAIILVCVTWNTLQNYGSYSGFTFFSEY